MKFTGGFIGGEVLTAEVVEVVVVSGAGTAAIELIEGGRIVFSAVRGIGSGGTTPEYKRPVSGKSGKEAATDVSSWAKGNRPYKGESGKDFAKRLLDEKYGSGNYDKDPGSEFNKIKKWNDRGFG